MSEKGRERVRTNKVKNVHAYVEGEYQGIECTVGDLYSQAYYDPYKTDQFIDKHDRFELLEADVVWFEGKDVYYK